MADTKISAMPAASTLDSTELVPLVQAGVNVQTSTLNFVNQTIQAFPSTARSSLGLGVAAPRVTGQRVSLGGVLIKQFGFMWPPFLGLIEVFSFNKAILPRRYDNPLLVFVAHPCEGFNRDLVLN